MLGRGAARDPIRRVRRTRGALDNTGGLEEFGAAADAALPAEVERLRLVAEELRHRLQNVYTLMYSLVSLTARQHPQSGAFADELLGRVHALGAANAAFGVAGDAGSVEIATLFEAILRPHDVGAERIRLRLHPHTVGAMAASALALIVQELATNAVKYGALSGSGGLVVLEGVREGDRYRLGWRERGGPAVDGAPKRSGLGAVLTTRAARQLGGELQRRWDPEGLTASLTIPCSALER